MQAASTAAKGEIDLQQDVRLPSLMLVQATTQVEGDARPGQILDTLTGDAADEVEIVPVSTFKTRAFFGGKSIGEPPTCTSPDALNGYGEVADKLKAEGALGPAGDSGACLRCPEGDWRRGGKCQLRFNYLAVLPGENVTHDVPRGVMMHGTSAKVASRLNTMLLAQNLFWGSTIVLSSKMERNDRGQYYLWNVARGRPANEEEMMVAFRYYKQFDEGRKMGATVEVTAPGDTPDSSDPDADVPF